MCREVLSIPPIFLINYINHIHTRMFFYVGEKQRCIIAVSYINNISREDMLLTSSLIRIIHELQTYTHRSFWTNIGIDLYKIKSVVRRINK